MDVPVDDLAPADRPKGARALAQLRFHEVRSPEDPAFAAGYDLLASFFGPLGELEAREVLASFVRQRVLPYVDGVDGTYHLVTAWDGDQLVGVRDCYTEIDHRVGVCLASLSHVYVVPAWRRTGVAAVLRAAPLTLARQVVAERLGTSLPTLVVAEMEPADPENLETVVRLLAYGRAGFEVLDPRRVPYSQPDLREHTDPFALPLLGVVRRVGVDEVSVPLAELFPLVFHTTHRMYLPAERVDPSERHLLANLRASAAPVPLLPLPTAVDALGCLAPLVRSAVLPLYPPNLRGERAELGDPAEELAAIEAAFRGRGYSP